MFLSVSYPKCSQSCISFEAKKPPKKLVSCAKDVLGPRPSKELLEELINRGLSNEEIAKKLKRAVQTIIGLRCMYNLPSEYEILVQKRTAQILERLQAGGNRKEIAKEFGLSMGTINVIAEKNNVFSQVVAERDNKICQLFKEGYSRKEIAGMLGVSVDTVKRTLHGNQMFYKVKSKIYDDVILQKILNNESNKKIMNDLNISVKREHGLTRIYNRLPKGQLISWTEIMDESKKVTEIREAFKRLKEGERTPEILEQISATLESLKSAIDGFRKRLG